MIVQEVRGDGPFDQISHSPAKASGAPDLAVGRKVRVKLISTNVERGFIDFVWLN